MTMQFYWNLIALGWLGASFAWTWHHSFMSAVLTFVLACVCQRLGEQPAQQHGASGGD